MSEPRSLKPPAIRTLPILPSTTADSNSPGVKMEISQPPSASMGPPQSSPNGERQAEQQQNEQSGQNGQNGSSSQLVGAAAAAQQPKVVQTAFIHKLYNMLEDQSIQHLISWSSSNESFVMSPSSEFSKVLAQYFKHTNISSFVRQLNMYGFHKVSDVFHTGSPDSPLWEFKHGAGNFKRGDLVGLREIKRRASRHALIHRDSFSTAPKMPAPPQPAPPMEPMPDPLEARLSVMDWNMQDMYARMSRTEEAYATMTMKCQSLVEGLVKCHQWNSELSTQLLALVPDPDNPVHRDIYAMRQDISRHMEGLRALEDSQESPFSKQGFFANSMGPMEPSVPVSPNQRPYDDSRRPSLQTTSRPNSFRNPVPAHLQVSPRRYGSIGTSSQAYSPSTSTRPNYPPPPPPPAQPPQQHQQQPQHPLSHMESPGLPRRHTSADIRLQGWQGGAPPPPPTHPYSTNNPPNPNTSSPYASGANSTAWPSSPRLPPPPLHHQQQPPHHQQENQQLRDALAQYELPRPSALSSRQPSPPSSGFEPPGWQLPGARFPFKGIDTAPPTRRSSMASNVHSLLNPAETVEREGEDGGAEGEEGRKRKRVL